MFGDHPLAIADERSKQNCHMNVTPSSNWLVASFRKARNSVYV
jgi:hypothetical protein